MDAASELAKAEQEARKSADERIKTLKYAFEDTC